MHHQPSVTTYLFTDIEGSTRLWEQDAERMRPALARHDALARAAVESNHGVVVKTLGDGVHAVFNDPLNAIGAALQLQLALTDPEVTSGVDLRVRCGLHAGVDERRDNDFFGNVVNRAARIMGAAHGGQILLSQAVALLVGPRLPVGVELRDLGAVRLRDLANPERIHQIVHPRLRHVFPALRSLEATPNNLPQQVTSFIGRERELIDVKKLLGETRFLTLLGTGGLGKTRLSLQAAADLMDDFPDGLWFIDLAPLMDERLVSQAVGSVLGVKEEVGRPTIEAIVKHVGHRRMLIILDNCEHLLGACSELAKQLLNAGPHLKILASSREQLRVKGETTYPVQPLSTPHPSQPMSLEELSRCEAVRLFVDRARSVRPGLQVSDENAQAIASICHRLDGIPLAIELAAARVRTLSEDELAARLSDRFRLLTRGDRTALPRQQTLRASIDWSYELLLEQERVLLQRLSVFAGGWTLEAAEAVGASGEIREIDVLDLLSELVDKSLVVAESDGARFRMLDTVREYALERLSSSKEESDGCRSRHLSYYVQFAEKVMPALVGPEQGRWLARLDLERENILAAHAWCDGASSYAEFGLRLVHAVKSYWVYRGLLGLGHRVTVEALARPGAQRRDLPRMGALLNAGQACCFMGRYEEAGTYLDECLSIAREIGDKGRIASVLQFLGMASLGLRSVTVARAHLEEALVLTRELGNKRELAAATNALAQLHRAEGQLDAAAPLYEEVLDLARELGDRESIAIGFLNLAMVAIGRGPGGPARKMLLDALAIAEEIGSKPVGLSVLEVCAGLAASLQQWESAARFFGMAEAQIQQTGIHRDPGDEAFLAPLITEARQAFGHSTFAEAERVGCTLPYEKAIAAARLWLETCV